MNESVKDRILAYARHIGITAHRLECELGISNGYFRSLRHCPSAKILERFYNRFPEVNRSWLLTGDGEMFQTSNSTIIGSQNNNSTFGDINVTPNNYLEKKIADLEERLKQKDRQVEQLLELLMQK